MSRAIVLALFSLSLLACGEPGRSEDGPKSRSNERGPVEREVERRAAPPSEERPVPGPTAEVAAPHAEPPRRVAAAEAPARPAPEPAAAPEPEVAPEPEAAPEPAPSLPAPGDITLARVVPTAAVEDREPAGAPRADAERTFAFVEAANASDVETELSIVFVSPDGDRGRPITLRLPPAPRWRTWATTRHTHGRPGRWVLVVSDASGEELARQPFEVAPAAGDAA